MTDTETRDGRALYPQQRSSFRVGVEGILPGEEDWFATIYGCWFGKYFTEEHLITALREVGAQFTLFYDSLAPRKTSACQRITEMCRRRNLPFLFNNTYGDIQGPWVEGLGHAEYTPEQLRQAAGSGLFLGVVWDEVAHRQLHHYDVGPGPYFFDPRGLSVAACYERMVEAVSEVVERYTEQGAVSVAELVFPVMVHTLARAGMVPAPKVLKESFNPLALAIGMGAALQYHREFWAVLDLWGVVPFWGSLFTGPWEGAPGHSPDEYLSALLMCYWMGLDAIYTEGLYNLIVPVHTTPEEWREIQENPIQHRGSDNPLVVDYRRKGYVMTAYGKLHRWFVREYLSAHPRPYCFRDVQPEVAIVVLPDSTWCSRTGSNWSSARTLFGPGGPEKLARHEALLDVFHLLTHGQVPREGFTLHNEPFQSRRAEIASRIELANDPASYIYDDIHTGFCPLNGVIVYDHRVGEDLLRDIPLIICVGETLTNSTRHAVRRCVRRGAKCLALPHLLPEVAQGATLRVVSEGAGRYLLAEDLLSPKVGAFVAPHLGATDIVRYQFGAHRVEFTPQRGDTRRLVVDISSEA